MNNPEISAGVGEGGAGQSAAWPRVVRPRPWLPGPGSRDTAWGSLGPGPTRRRPPASERVGVGRRCFEAVPSPWRSSGERPGRPSRFAERRAAPVPVPAPGLGVSGAGWGAARPRRAPSPGRKAEAWWAMRSPRVRRGALRAAARLGSWLLGRVLPHRQDNGGSSSYSDLRLSSALAGARGSWKASC